MCKFKNLKHYFFNYFGARLILAMRISPRKNNKLIERAIKNVESNALETLTLAEFNSQLDIKELVPEALERREEMALSAIAKMRDTKHDKMIKHDDAWK